MSWPHGSVALKGLRACEPGPFRARHRAYARYPLVSTVSPHLRVGPNPGQVTVVPAIDQQRLAGGELAFGQAEEEDGGGDVVGGADAAEGDHPRGGTPPGFLLGAWPVGHVPRR